MRNEPGSNGLQLPGNTSISQGQCHLVSEDDGNLLFDKAFGLWRVIVHGNETDDFWGWHQNWLLIYNNVTEYANLHVQAINSEIRSWLSTDTETLIQEAEANRFGTGYNFRITAEGWAQWEEAYSWVESDGDAASLVVNDLGGLFEDAAGVTGIVAAISAEDLVIDALVALLLL